MKREIKQFFKKIKFIAACFALALVPLPTYASNTAQMTFTVTVTSSCSVSLPPQIDLGTIPATAFDGILAGGEIAGYDKNFTITTTCYGANRYTLTFTPSVVNYNCAVATSGIIGYCLYHNNEKIQLAGNNSVTGEGNNREIRVVPLRVNNNIATAGVHNSTLNVTISPL